MFDRSDFARYPFLPAAAKYVQALNITQQDLQTAEFSRVNERAKMRIRRALAGAETREVAENDDVEILSFPRAVMLLDYVHDDLADRRFALYEAKQAYGFLISETGERLVHLASAAFSWDIQPLVSGVEPRFKLHFSDYLRCSTAIKEARLRLINRRLEKGYLTLTKAEAARLLQEEVMQKILSRFSPSPPAIPEQEMRMVDELRELIRSKTRRPLFEDVPRKMTPEAMPPCIRWLHESLTAGKNISHMGRFTLTSFLLNVGATRDEVFEYFRASTDFDMEKSRYQVEHIEGLRGVKRKYTPPKCDTLRTHGICHNPDRLCSTLRHPLIYYRRRLKTGLAARE